MTETRTPPINISCSDEVKDILCEALNSYAQEVLPEAEAGFYGATRHQMLNVVRHIRQSPENHLCIDSQYKGPCVAAVHYHFSIIRQTIKSPVAEQRQLLLDVLQGVPACGEELESAWQRDNLL